MTVRADLRSEIMDRADDPSGAVAKSHQVNRWIGLGIRDVWTRWPWTFTEDDDATLATTAADPLLLLPIGVQRPKRIIDAATDEPLEPGRLQALQDEFRGADTGCPRKYCDGGLVQADLKVAPRRAVRLFPTPDVVYTYKAFFLRPAPTLTDDKHHSPLPEEFDEAIILWCLIRFYRKLEDIVAAREHSEALTAEILRLIGEFSVHQVQRPPYLDYYEPL